MKISAVNECIKEVQGDLGEALITTNIVGLKDGQAIASYNSSPKLDAIVAQMTTFLQNVMKNTEQRRIEKYYFIQLENKSAGVFIVVEDYVWFVNFDASKTSMGMMLNVYMPDMIAKLEAAV